MATKKDDVIRDGRRLSAATAWWFDNKPRAYTLYCVHNIRLNAECKKCNHA